MKKLKKKNHIKKKINKFIKSYVANFKNHKRFRMINYAALVLILCPLVITLGRFVASSISEHYFNSKEFYFNSTTLTGDNTDLYGWNGKNNYSIAIKLNNSKDLLNWTKYDIDYKLSATCTSSKGDLNCPIIGPNKLVASESAITNNENTLTIEKGELNLVEGDIVNVEVKAESTNPYKKTIIGNYKIHINSLGFTYYIVDDINKNYLEFILENDSNEDKTVTIDYDETLLNIDITNYFVKNGTSTNLTYNFESINIANPKIVVSLEHKNGSNYELVNMQDYTNDILTSYSTNNYNLGNVSSWTYTIDEYIPKGTYRLNFSMYNSLVKVSDIKKQFIVK